MKIQLENYYSLHGITSKICIINPNFDFIILFIYGMGYAWRVLAVYYPCYI